MNLRNFYRDLRAVRRSFGCGNRVARFIKHGVFYSLPCFAVRQIGFDFHRGAVAVYVALPNHCGNDFCADITAAERKGLFTVGTCELDVIIIQLQFFVAVCGGDIGRIE